MSGGNFSHLDPDKTFIYKDYTILYGFDTGDRCFTCKVRNGYLIGKRADLPPGMEFAIGQHIDTMKMWCTKMLPLRLAGKDYDAKTAIKQF